MIKNILYLGDASAYCDFGSEVNEHVNSRVISYFTKIKKKKKKKKIDGIINLTPSYNKLIISFDLDKTNFTKVKEIVKDLKTDTLAKKNTKKIKFLITYLFLLSVILELFHLIISNRRFEISDLFGNIAGVIFVIIIYKVKDRYV